MTRLKTRRKVLPRNDFRQRDRRGRHQVRGFPDHRIAEGERRRLGGAKTLDAQAGYESASTLMAVLMSGSNYIWHSAGLHCSVGKFVVDAEQCAMGYRMAEGIRWDDFDEALAAVRDIGPDGHSLGHPHTLANFERAFFMPELFDNRPYEQWLSDGAEDTTVRALRKAHAMLEDYEAPPLDPGVEESLRDYMTRRMREIPEGDALNEEY